MVGKTTIYVLLLSVVVVVSHGMVMQLSEAMNIGDIVAEIIICLLFLFIINVLSRNDRSKSFLNILIAGFVLLYFSMLMDILDELYVQRDYLARYVENVFQVIGSATVCVGIFKWMTFNDQLLKKLKRLSSTDALTGILNRRAFLEGAEAEMERSRRYGHPFALLLIDIDWFKKINDSHGHNVGDEVLKQVCATIIPMLRKNDLFCRWGGEEFILLLPETDKGQALTVGEKLRKTIESYPIKVDNQASTNLTISLGCTLFDGEDEPFDRVVATADQALYTSKENGRNRVTLI